MAKTGVSVLTAALVACGAAAAEPQIHIIYMGGNDCPPCRAWRATELPKLQTTDAFRKIRFTYVDKLIGSAVPPALFLPADARPYKAQLDEPGNRIVGSPQTAVIVDGKVFDYYWGTRNAEEIETMIASILRGSRYPFERCVKRETQRKCAARK